MCANNSKIKAIILIKKPSKYLIKKYGEEEAERISIEKAIKNKKFIRVV